MINELNRALSKLGTANSVLLNLKRQMDRQSWEYILVSHAIDSTGKAMDRCHKALNELKGTNTCNTSS